MTTAGAIKACQTKLTESRDVRKRYKKEGRGGEKENTGRQESHVYIYAQKLTFERDLVTHSDRRYYLQIQVLKLGDNTQVDILRQACGC